jgi:hypothetical protein
VTAHADEPDAPFRDQSPGKTLGGAQQVGDLGYGEEPLHLGHRSPGHQAALPVVEASAARASRASLDRGTKLLEQLPRPDHPEHHFVFDHTKWIFYAATCYTWLGDDEPAEEHAREIIAYHTNPDGSSNAPMRTANAHIDLGIVLARHGELDEAVDHGLQAFQFERKTEASLLSHAADLDHDLEQLYPRERLAEPFHDQYADARRRLRSQRRLRR